MRHCEALMERACHHKFQMPVCLDKSGLSDTLGAQLRLGYVQVRRSQPVTKKLRQTPIVSGSECNLGQLGYWTTSYLRQFLDSNAGGLHFFLSHSRQSTQAPRRWIPILLAEAQYITQ
jgi:hypothetical protein